ncbi:MAG: FAD-binding protein [Phycisphaerales bacterium]|nr:FAD-binding protein [Phycisphaerales bacterium]
MERRPVTEVEPELERRRQTIARDLSHLIAGEVRFDPHNRGLYATDASLYQVEPIGVVIPRSTDEALAVVRYASDHDVPILPRGAGSSLAGQTVNRAVVIDFSPHCRRVLEVDTAGRSCWVEPGVVLDDLNDSLARQGAGLLFGPDVATSAYACLGGMIGNNSSGARSIIYGRTVENLLALDVVLANGERVCFDAEAGRSNATAGRITRDVVDVVHRCADEIRARFPTTGRRVNGYNLDLILDAIERGGTDAVNLAHLLCGSEGTLAVTLRAKLKLAPVPKHTSLAILAFDSLDAALQAVNPILGTAPSAVELLDDMVLQAAQLNTQARRHLRIIESFTESPPNAVLYVEYYGDAPDELADKLGQLRTVVADAPQRHITDADEMARAWALRKAVEPLLHAIPGLRKPLTFVEDTAVEPRDLPAFVREFRRIVESHGTTAAFYAHASVGCLHIRPMLAVADPTDREHMTAIAESVTDLVKSFGGALSGEHGDGRARSPLLERFYSPRIIDAFREIKAIFDPNNLLNPGNIVQPAPLLDHLRVRPGTSDVTVPTIDAHYDYADQHGFAGAVMACNGAGVCRRTAEGTMCPSYRATLDERYSTRGRGNALRLAITGQFGGPAFSDPATLETLDLCLSCKACKSECPSNVDIAKLKAEYLAQHYAAIGRVPLKARAVGHVRALSRLASIIAPLSNIIAGNPIVRRLLEPLVDLDRRRPLPKFRASLYRWQRRRDKADSARPTVCLFADCFTTYHEPNVGRAAIRVLEAFGYHVLLPDVDCCGRAMLSVGMVRDAIRKADRTLSLLAPMIEDEDVLAIIVCEPSCLSMFRDDYLDLRCETPIELRRALAAKAMLVEEFLDSRWGEHPIRPVVKESQGEVLLHAHCHQESLFGHETSSNLIRRLIGDRLRVLDTGCCGMAGAFGYRKNHYELSMKIGEESLFPAVRAAAEDAIIVAPGTSCRQQIHDGTTRSALHPIELVDQILDL